MTETNTQFWFNQPSILELLEVGLGPSPKIFEGINSQ